MGLLVHAAASGHRNGHRHCSSPCVDGRVGFAGSGERRSYVGVLSERETPVCVLLLLCVCVSSVVRASFILQCLVCEKVQLENDG